MSVSPPLLPKPLIAVYQTEELSNIDHVFTEPCSMTNRNLNRTWRDVVFVQYTADLEADVPFPVRYLINIPIIYGMPGRDVFITIPVKIEVQTLKRAVIDFHLATRHGGDPTYEDEHISVRPRKPARQTTGEAQLGRDDDGGGGDSGVEKEFNNENGDGSVTAC